MNSEIQFFVRQNYKRDYSIQRHTHPCYELVYYLEGTGTSGIDKTQYHFEKDTFALVKPNTIHSESSDNNSKVFFIGFTTDEPLTEGMYYNNTTPIRELMEEIEREMENKKPYYKRMLNLLVDKIVLYLLRYPVNDAKEKANFEDILTYIKMNANKNVSVQQMAFNLGYSYDYFRQLFVEKTGMSAKKYLTNLKITNAKEYLLNTDYSVNKIARITGFSSPSHLCTVFKEHIDLTPNEYRQQQRDNSYRDNKPDFS